MDFPSTFYVETYFCSSSYFPYFIMKNRDTATKWWRTDAKGLEIQTWGRGESKARVRACAGETYMYKWNKKKKIRLLVLLAIIHSFSLPQVSLEYGIHIVEKLKPYYLSQISLTK